MEVIRENEHDHKVTESRKRKLNNDEKIKLGEVICAKFGGSTYDARLTMINNEDNVQSAHQFKKAKSAYKNKDLPSNEWLTNIRIIAETFKVSKQAYIHQLSFHPDFSMILHLETQREIIRSIPVESRIGHIDSTGILVSIPKKKANYSPIMNYFFLIKDLRFQETPLFTSCLIGELVTSNQTVMALS